MSATVVFPAVPVVLIAALSGADPLATMEAAPAPAVRAVLPAWGLRGVAEVAAAEEAAAVAVGGNQL